MTDALHEFAHLAALALRDITDPDATVHAADEALASLEQHVTALGREYRPAARLVSRALYQLHSGVARNPECLTEEALGWLQCAARWPHMDPGLRGSWNAAKCTERASHVADQLGGNHRELRELTRAVIAAVESVVLECVVEKTNGGQRDAA